MLAEVLAKLEAKGHRAAAVPIERLEELREHYEDLSRRGLLDERLAEGLLTGLSLRPPETVPRPGSLVVVATRDPAVCCTFRWQGADVPVPVPPTYLHLRRKSEKVTRELAELLPQQSHVECLINAPHKLLAVRSGLARYGRNNITYISGLGSFYGLTTVCTDVPCDDGEWLGSIDDAEVRGVHALRIGMSDGSDTRGPCPPQGRALHHLLEREAWRRSVPRVAGRRLAQLPCWVPALPAGLPGE